MAVQDGSASQALVRRHFAGEHDLNELAKNAEDSAPESPELGTRVRIVDNTSKYNPKDFEKTGTFESYEGKWAETVAKGSLGVIMQKAPHFEKPEVEVFLIKLDNSLNVVMPRSGFHPPLYVGCPIYVINQGAVRAANDFKDKEGFQWLKLSDKVHIGQRGVLVRMVPGDREVYYVIVLDDKMQSVVMAAKGVGCGPNPTGLDERLSKRKKQRAAKRKAEADGEPEAKKANVDTGEKDVNA
eukprot:TRINITY_DN361_c0_g2_i1.p1 TRINITY_DN361_c0_g2~~TRINITY_DN361_c0_g2_i1.p1  ORF type:complete len:241 (+),score=92.09 TRINITY_DN361_c0_g2_i1:82-804(+)